MDLGGAMEYSTFLKKVATQYQLGELNYEPKQVPGGLLHTMFRLDTEQQVVAVKLLNPNVMKRAEAISNYEQADRLEEQLKLMNIPIIPALVLNGKKRQLLEGQYFYLYPWFDGKSLIHQQISRFHCAKISNILAQIHSIDVRKVSYQHPRINIQWDEYVEVARLQNQAIYTLLVENQTLLDEVEKKANASFINVIDIETICHNDMDSKNVLWIQEDCKIIDCECLSYGNPYIELLEMALCWSGLQEGKINYDLFNLFIDTYFAKSTLSHINWKAIYDSNVGRLEWLEYNLRRALWFECDDISQQQLALQQVDTTMKQIQIYLQSEEQIMKVLALYSSSCY